MAHDPTRAELPPPGAENVLYLIDLSGYVFRAYHALPPLSNTKGEPTHAIIGTVNMVQKVVNERRPSLLAVAMDSRGVPGFRREIDPRYKATRPPAPPDLDQQMKRCEQIVRAYNIPVYQEPGLEADDLIASVVTRAASEGLRVVIVSMDKDMLQLVHDDDSQVVMWNSMHDKVYGPREVEEKLGVRPSQVRDYLALVGDSSDNVPGVRSVGPKTAVELLKDFQTLDGVYAHKSEIKRQKLREALEQYEDDARISQRLVSLRVDPGIAWDLAQLKYGGANTAELRKLFIELEFTRLIGQLPAPPQVPRAYRTITTRDELVALAKEARATKTLAIGLFLSGEDPNRAEIVGMGLAAKAGDGVYLPLTHRYLGVPVQPKWEVVKETLGPILTGNEVKKIAHDMKTIEVTLARHDIMLGGPLFDTMIASYLLDPENPHQLGPVVRRELDFELPSEVAAKKAKGPPLTDTLDVETATKFQASGPEACVTLCKHLEERLASEKLGNLWSEMELPLSRVLAHMELVGVLCDTSRLASIGKRVEEEAKKLEARAMVLVGHDFAIRSRDQLESILFDEMKLPVLKRTPKGGRSTDAEVLEELAADHELARVLLDYREIDKLKGTYVDALPRYVNPKTGRIHTRFQQTVAATGRLSSTDPNLQNIPIRTALGKEIRTAFVAPPGTVLVSADYSQIELRVLAHLSQDPMLLQAYQKSEDVHQLTASVVFDVPREQVTQDQRRQAKTINFGVIYGMGEAALARQLGINREDAARFIANYFTRYEGVAKFMTKTVEDAKRGEAVRTILGRRRFLPNLHSANRGLRAEAERIAKNTPIQGTAADILKLAMVHLKDGEVVPGARMVLTVHDELVFEVPEKQADLAMKRIQESMQGAMKLDVPLTVEVGKGHDWSEAH